MKEFNEIQEDLSENEFILSNISNSPYAKRYTDHIDNLLNRI